MVAFVKGIFYDLSGRIQKMLVDLDGRQNQNDIPPKFFQKTLSLLSDLNQDVNTILVSADIAFEEFAGNHIIKYNTLHERFLAIELYRYQVIVHYGPNERHFDALIKRIYDEVECLQSTPIVSGISNNDSYYWVYPTYDIIAVPYGEEKNLLNLPDLYHEIGHLIYGQHTRFFKGQGSIDKALEDHFNLEIKNIDDENRDKSRIPDLKKAFENWKESWIEEFVCDLIASYLTGPAYGWTNLKISTISSSDKGIFSITASHPSDESRMYAVFTMLQKMGYNNELHQLQSSWQIFTDISANGRIQLYDIILPRHIIELLTNTVFDACQKIGLLSCCEQKQQCDSPISHLLNEAWNENLMRPETFAEWESNHITHLRNQLI